MCGEKPAVLWCGLKLPGSPPHVRGKVLEPAPAGGKDEDHPRMCGEKGQKVLNQRYTTGSPPHVRGKACRPSGGHLAIGITPACAGKRGGMYPSGGRPQDHPRMCGEKTKKIP